MISDCTILNYGVIDCKYCGIYFIISLKCYYIHVGKSKIVIWWLTRYPIDHRTLTQALKVFDVKIANNLVILPSYLKDLGLFLDNVL